MLTMNNAFNTARRARVVNWARRETCHAGRRFVSKGRHAALYVANATWGLALARNQSTTLFLTDPSFQTFGCAEDGTDCPTHCDQPRFFLCRISQALKV